LAQYLVAVLGIVLLASPSRSASLKPDEKLPDPVEKTFRATFPKAEIDKVDATEENGIMVYDIEFTDGKQEKETDIAADGTMLEYTLVIAAKAIPPAAMKSIKAAAKGAKLGRCERIEITYETKDGAVVKLAEAVTRYAAEMARKGQNAEVIVSVDGTVVEPPTWVSAK
jgi:uncharacterized membrane protein YkoI